ncbi:MAG: tetratricopeptide repeat protein [Clostridium celatum]|nr:tetratricopeptide repeat protein [Clostridium celatum]
MHKLANMYLHGLGTIENHKYAYVWYKKLAYKGNTLGMRMLGYAYLNGDTVDVNNDEAFYWYSNAVKHGDYEACIPLAFMYENGLGTEKNKKMADELLKRTSK